MGVVIIGSNQENESVYNTRGILVLGTSLERSGWIEVPTRTEPDRLSGPISQQHRFAVRDRRRVTRALAMQYAQQTSIAPKREAWELPMLRALG